MAVAAAIEKAGNYCLAADVALGPVIHIEDVNPTVLQGHEARLARGPTTGEEDERGALDPSLIEIGAAVFVTFEIIKRS
jgi:uncharacterized protein YggE